MIRKKKVKLQEWRSELKNAEARTKVPAVERNINEITMKAYLRQFCVNVFSYYGKYQMPSRTNLLAIKEYKARSGKNILLMTMWF